MNELTGMKKTRQRSPNYPAIGLEKALEKVNTIYEQGKMNPVPLPAAFQMWNYKEAAGNQTVAALKAFGLIDVTGEKEYRQLHVTENARRILRNHQDRDRLLREAAIKPELHKELWGKYQENLPADSIIRHYLIFERPARFNEESVDSFIAQFKNTIVFAKLSLSDKVREEEDGEGHNEREAMTDTDSAHRERKQKDLPPPPAGQRDFPLYLTNRQKGGLYIPAEMSKKDYDLLKQQIDNHLAIILLTSVTPDEEEQEQQ